MIVSGHSDTPTPPHSHTSYRVAVVGLGKIGLPLAAQYASRGWRVRGCDRDPTVVETLNRGIAHVVEEPELQERVAAANRAGLLDATTDTSAAVAQSDVVVTIVPLVVDEAKRPDFGNLDAATRAVAASLRPGTLVLFETTVPVGTTRERLLPILEGGGLKAGVDFWLGYSPERVSSGSIFRDLATYPKIVGGVDPESARRAAAFYEAALDAAVMLVDSAETAEFTKLVETTYRDVNIALANEFARYAERRGIDVIQAIEAANTQPYSHVHTPGVGVGGHCIPVYPHFLLADDTGLRLPRVAREINDCMPEWVAERLAGELGGLAGRSVLVLGLAYRGDVREDAFSAAPPLVAALRDRGARVLMHDTLLGPDEIERAGAEPVALEPYPAVDAIVVQAWHSDYRGLDFARFPGCKVLVDGRNLLAAASLNGVRYLGVGRPGRSPSAV